MLVVENLVATNTKICPAVNLVIISVMKDVKKMAMAIVVKFSILEGESVPNFQADRACIPTS